MSAPGPCCSCPRGLWYALFLIGPLVVLFVFSFGIRAPNGGYVPGFTLDQYAAIDTRITPLVNTVWYATMGTIACLLVAYPLAYYLATRAGDRKFVLLALVVIPLWTSFLIRTYAWMFILGSNGLPRVWDELGLGRLVLLNTPFAVVLGIVYNYLPLMILAPVREPGPSGQVAAGGSRDWVPGRSPRSARSPCRCPCPAS
ncbi:MAG: hypothetical protein R3C32_14460 [Chloroflexota bacterium]